VFYISASDRQKESSEYIKTKKEVVRTHTVTMVFVKDWLIRIYYDIIKNVEI